MLEGGKVRQRGVVVWPIVAAKKKAKKPTRDMPHVTSGKTLPPEVLAYFREQGVIGGKLGGQRRRESLTPTQRRDIAKKAARARWGKGKKRT